MSEEFQPINRQDITERAVVAARNAGSAAAMMSNMTTIGSEKHIIWFHEARAWEKRRDELIATLPTNRKAITELAAEATMVAFADDIVSLEHLRGAPKRAAIEPPITGNLEAAA